jgi:hypothetical protein
MASTFHANSSSLFLFCFCFHQRIRCITTKHEQGIWKEINFWNVCVFASVFYVRINVGWLPDELCDATLRQLKEVLFSVFFFIFCITLTTAADRPTDCCSECDVSRHQRRQVGLQSRISASMDRFQVPSEKAIPSLASLLHFVFNVTPATTTLWMLTSIEQLLRCVSISCCIIHCYASNTLRDVSGAAAVVLLLSHEQQWQPWRGDGLHISKQMIIVLFSSNRCITLSFNTDTPLSSSKNIWLLLCTNYILQQLLESKWITHRHSIQYYVLLFLILSLTRRCYLSVCAFRKTM